MTFMLIGKDESTSAQDLSNRIHVWFDMFLDRFQNPLNTERTDRREVVAVFVHGGKSAAGLRGSYTGPRMGGCICRVFSDEHWLRGQSD